MNFVFDFQMLNLGIALLGFIIINILLGSINGILERKFDKEKFINGIIKGGIVAISFVGVYFIGTLIPDVMIDINGQEITILMAVNLIVVSGLAWYAKEVLVKLASFVKAKFGG